MKDKIFIITIIILLCIVSYFLINNIDKLKLIDVLEKNIEECKNDCNKIINNENVNNEKNENLNSNQENKNCFGHISGILDLGEENLIQNGIYICAKNLSSKEYYCTSEIINNYNNSGKRGYEIFVLPGKYQLSGIYPHSIDPNYPLKEFKYSSCSSNGICEETLVTFEVLCDEKKENININNTGLTEIFKDFNIYKK